MRVMLLSLVGLAFLFGSAAHAEPARRDCSKVAKRKARAAAGKAMRAKDPQKAIALLEPFVRDCRGRDPVESGWLAADLAVAYEKAGQLVACQRLMAPLSHPKSGLSENGSDKLVKAIAYNLDRCSKALDAQYAAIKPGGCTLTVDRAIATAAVPAAMVPRGATAACVALVRGQRPARMAQEDDDDGDDDVVDVVCPKVALVWKGARPALEHQALTSSGDADALTDESFCCNLSSIAAGTTAGKTLVRVRGHGRECSGGTADAATDVFYEWKGATLTQALDASVGFH